MSLPVSVLLDPSEVAENRSELDLESGSIRIAKDGIDLGSAEIQSYMAEAARGQIPVDFRVPNRSVQIPLMLGDEGTESFEQAREALEQKVALFQREGGWLKFESDAGPYFLDVVNATLQQGRGSLPILADFDPDVVLSLECLPDFYGEEIDTGDHVETSAAELIFILTGIEGSYPGRVRFVIDNDDATNDQRGLIVAFRSRNYSSASTAALKYEAEALTALGSAAIATRSGASGGGSNNVVRYINLSNLWTPVVGTNLAAGSFLTHKGNYRVFARVGPDESDVTSVKLRLVWDVGDLVAPTENDPVTIPNAFGTVSLYIVDLGEIRLDEVGVGAHRWQGQIQAKGAVGGEDIDIDKLWIVPTDEAFCRLSAPPIASTIAEQLLAWDTFLQSAGALATKVAPLGGTWTGAGDADDFALDITNDWIERTAVSDTTAVNGRYARLGTGTPTTTTVQVDLSLPGVLGADRSGVFARYVDTSNWLMAYINTAPGPPFSVAYTLVLSKRKAGTETMLASVSLGYGLSGWRTLQLYVGSDGNISVYAVPQGSSLGSALIAFNGGTDFQSGGTLANGGYGIYEAYTNSSPPSVGARQFDNFNVMAPVTSQVMQDAVAYKSQSVQLGTDGVFREDSTGTSSGPLTPIGDLLRIPPSGSEGRTVEVFAKATRSDFETIADAGIDDISGRLFCRPSFLFPPGL